MSADGRGGTWQRADVSFPAAALGRRHLEGCAVHPQRRAGGEMRVRGGSKGACAARVGPPAGGLRNGGEVSSLSVEADYPLVEVPDGAEMIALGAVAAVGQHQVLDGIIRPARPSKEVVDLPTPTDRITAVEALAVLKVADPSDESGGK